MLKISEDEQTSTLKQENSSIIFQIEKNLPYGDLSDSTPNHLRNIFELGESEKHLELQVSTEIRDIELSVDDEEDRIYGEAEKLKRIMGSTYEKANPYQSYPPLHFCQKCEIY